MRTSSALLAALLAAVSGQALAQDVVVMRRQVSESLAGNYAWDPGTLVADAPACSPQAPATRVPVCRDTRTDKAVDPGKCFRRKPDTTGTVADYRACVVRWDEPQFGEYEQSCSDLTKRTRSVTCQRFATAQSTTSVGRADDAACSYKPKPAETIEAANYAGCTHVWKDAPTDCTGTKRNHVVTCQRSGGTVATSNVDDVWCTTTKPETQTEDATCKPASLIENGDFENGSTKWGFYSGGSGSGTVTGLAKRSGGAGAHLTASSARLEQTFSYDATKSNTLTLWARSATASCTTLSLQVYSPQVAGAGHYTQPLQVCSGWQSFSLGFTALGTANPVNAVLRVTSGGPIYIDDVTVVASDAGSRMTCGAYASQTIGSTSGIVVGRSSNVTEAAEMCATRSTDGNGVCTLDDSTKVVTYHPGGARISYAGSNRLYSMVCTVQ